MTRQKMQTIRLYHSVTNGTNYVLIDMTSEQVTRPINNKMVSLTQENEIKTSTNSLLRSDNEKCTSHKHNGTKTKRKAGPRETYIACKNNTPRKRMRPMTSKDRHNANRALRSCVTTLNNKALRQLLNIEVPDKWYGYVSTVINPYEDMLGLQFSDTKLPMQYGYKKKTAQYTHKQDYILHGRLKKALIQAMYNQNEQPTLSSYYDLDPEKVTVYIISNAPKENLRQEWNRMQKKIQKQRFDNCVHTIYYPKMHEKQK